MLSMPNLKRVIKFAFQDIMRNKGLSLQVIFIMTFSILTLTSLFIFRELSSFLIEEAQKKVDISVYFKKNVSENSILEVKEKLYQFSENIEAVEYISAEQAKDKFIKRHQQDSLYLDALKEVGGNPFLPYLNIKAKNLSAYDQISDFLSKPPFSGLIEKISYYQNKNVIERLFSFTSKVNNAGIFFSAGLMVLVFLIVLNTIKLTILTKSEEIATMRLVGASNWFIKAPFLVQVFIYGLVSILVVDVLLLICFLLLNNWFQNWFLGFNILSFFGRNFLLLFGAQISIIFLLGASSFSIAVQKYLKI